MKNYTQDANEFVQQLMESGYVKSDIFTKFVSGGKQVVYPIVGEDGHPHLEKRTFKN